MLEKNQATILTFFAPLSTMDVFMMTQGGTCRVNRCFKSVSICIGKLGWNLPEYTGTRDSL